MWCPTKILPYLETLACILPLNSSALKTEENVSQLDMALGQNHAAINVEVDGLLVSIYLGCAVFQVTLVEYLRLTELLAS